MEGRNDPERQTGRQKGTRQRSDSAKSAIDDYSSEIVQTPLPSSPLSFTACVGCQRQLLYPKHFPSSYRRFCLFVCHFLNLINDSKIQTTITELSEGRKHRSVLYENSVAY